MLVALPDEYWHDPFCMFLGVFALQVLVRIVHEADYIRRRLQPQLYLFNFRTWMLCKYKNVMW